MFRKMAWVMIAFFFMWTAGITLFVFTRLLLVQYITIVELDIVWNRLEFGAALLVFAVAIFSFVYSIWRLVKWQ